MEMVRTIIKLFHQLTAVVIILLIVLGALFALASLSKSTIADLFRLPLKESMTQKNPLSTSPPPIDTSPIPSEQPAVRPKLSLGLVAHTRSPENLQSGLNKLQGADVNAIILLGNVTQSGSVDELRQVKQMLDQVRLPTYFIPGTNDLQSSINQGLGGYGFISSIFGVRPNSQMYQEVDLAGLRLLLLDNADPTIGMTPEQWNWLATTLEEINKDTPVFLFLFTRTQTTPPASPPHN